MDTLILVAMLSNPIFTQSNTCIVIVNYQNVITIGADCRKRQLDDTDDTPHTEACKIFLVGARSGYTVAGFVSPTLHEYAKDILLAYPDSIGIAARLFYESYVEYVNSEYAKETPEGLAPLVGTPTNVLFFGFEGGIATIWKVGFCLFRNGDVFDFKKSVVKITDQAFATGNVKVLYEPIDIVRNDETWRNGFVQGIEYLIGVSAKHNPKFVGGRNTIVEIHNDGVNWIAKGACD